MAPRFRLGLAIADALTREGRRLLFSSQPDFDVVYEEPDGKSLMATLPEAAVDLVLVDTRLRSLAGPEAIARYLRRNTGSESRPPIFVLTGPFGSAELELTGVRCGASAVVSEEDSVEQILNVVRSTLQRDPEFSLLEHVNFFANMGVQHSGNPRWILRLTGLNEDEQKILDAIQDGADIAQLREITGLPATKVRWTLDGIQTRLGLSTRAQLSLALYEAGLTPVAKA